ncbi:MAG: DNA-3-methyladenine glycosylase family protein [Acidimicrobiales bacterium]
MRTFEIEVPAPFRLDLTVWALRRRSHNAVDRFDGVSYQRTLVIRGRPVELSVRQEPEAATPLLSVELRGAGAAPSDRRVAVARGVLQSMLGLDVDLEGFYRLAEHDARLSALARRFVGVRPPRFPSVFEAVVNAIACQQLSLIVGIHLLNRLARRYGPATSAGGGAPGFPTPEGLAEANPEDLRELGFSRSKASAVTSLALRVATGDLDLEALAAADDEQAMATLLGLSGIGRWSAEYTLLRGLGRLHVLPGDDVGARNNLEKHFGLDPSGGYDAVAELSRSWAPYGGLVYFHLLLDSLATAGHVAPTVGPKEAPARRRPDALDPEMAR